MTADYGRRRIRHGSPIVYLALALRYDNCLDSDCTRQVNLRRHRRNLETSLPGLGQKSRYHNVRRDYETKKAGREIGDLVSGKLKYISSKVNLN